jgi:hypothetical protein
LWGKGSFLTFVCPVVVAEVDASVIGPRVVYVTSVGNDRVTAAAVPSAVSEAADASSMAVGGAPEDNVAANAAAAAALHRLEPMDASDDAQGSSTTMKV